jgi:hypothetical protein
LECSGRVLACEGGEDHFGHSPDDEEANGNTDVFMTNAPRVSFIMPNYGKAGFAIGSVQLGSNERFQSKFFLLVHCHLSLS